MIGQFRTIVRDFKNKDDGMIVVVDESKFQIHKNNRGHRAIAVWILKIVQRTPENIIKLIAVEKNNNYRTVR